MLIVSAAVSAQNREQKSQYSSGETRLLGRIYMYVPRQGMLTQFQDGLKKHMAWHRDQKDPLTWETWEVVTGQSIGSYISYTMPSWDQLAAWDAKFAVGAAADAAINVTPYIEGEVTAYWVYRDDISRPTPGAMGRVQPPRRGSDDQPQILPAAFHPQRRLHLSFAASNGFPLVQLVNFQVKPESEVEFNAVLKKVRDAMVKENWQPDQGYFWYQLGAGGDEPQLTLLLPKHSWSDVTAPGNQMAETNGLFAGVLEAAYGKEEGDRLLETLGRATVRKWTDVVEKRPELSYLSAASGYKMQGAPAEQ
jgi:hypothetical protein